MLLAIDVGNTNIVVGVFEGSKLVESWRLATDNRRSADEYGTILGSMYRRINITEDEFYEKTPIVVEQGIKTGIKINYENPRALGADRLVNAVAAHIRYGGNLIVIDFGTATTFDCVSEDGTFLGGAIAPGMKTQAAALFEHTAKLPNVDLEIPGKFIARNTTEGMQSGLIYGHMGFTEHMVKGMKQEMSKELGCDPDSIKVIATGGMATMVESGVDCIDVIDRRLTLDGLQMLHEKNKGLNKKRVLQD